jgi:outer membrane protein TolC
MMEPRYGTWGALLLTALAPQAAQAAPTQTAPTQAAPTQTAPTQAAPTQTALAQSPLPATPEQNGVPLSDQRAVELALKNNPSVRSLALGVDSATEQVRAEQDRYPYSLVGDAGYTRSESPQLRADDSVASSASRSLDTSVGIRRTFPFGGTAEVRAENEYFNRDTQSVTVSPFLPADSGHATTLRASLTQPLLRGFGTRVGELDLRVARSGRTAAQRALRRARSALVRDVLSAYYELWYATEAVKIERASLALAREQQREAEARVAAGALSPVEVLTFQTRSAELEESVVSARLVQKQQSIRLSRLMGLSTGDPVSWQPVTAAEPGPVDERPSVAALGAALANDSLELAELSERVHTAELRARVAGEASRPRLDGDAYVQSNGVSRRFPDAWQRAGEFDWYSAHVGVTLELPLTDGRRQAQAAQARLDVQSARSDLESARQDLATNANLALETDVAARERLAGAQRTLAIAERTHEAAVARFELGQTTAITLQQAEDDLRRARLRVVRARVDVVQQRVALDHIVGRLVKR